MTPQEKDLITQLLGRLPRANEPKDAEAAALIADTLRQRPDAPYFLVQTVLIQDMALAQAQQRIEALERERAAAQQAAQPQQPTSFLGRALHGSVPTAGPWGAAPSAPPSPSSSGVWSQSGGAPMQAAPPPVAIPWGAGSGGFLRQAASTAAGIAGGALLFQGIQSLFGPHYGNFLGGMPAQAGISETVINNYYGDQSPDPNSQQADYQANNTDPGYGNDQDLADNQDNQDVGGDFDSGDSGNFDV